MSLNEKSPMVTGWLELAIIKLALAFEMAFISLRHLKNPINAVRAVRTLAKKYRTIFDQDLMCKVARVDGKYYWRFATPGFPSYAGRKMRANELNREFNFKNENGVGILLLGITKKCSLSCKHCYEWSRMHEPDKLSVDDLISIVRRYQDYGTTMMVLGGGEPLLRIKDIGTIMDNAIGGTDFWVVTSGWKLDREKAEYLKRKGLTGVMISIDHHDPQSHDTFRGRQGIFEMATNAAVVAKRAGLVTGLSLCPSRAYANKGNLINYMEFARSLGVTYIQIIEPRQAGRYAEKDVMLSQVQFEALDWMYSTYNESPDYKEYPIVIYNGYRQRRTGCLACGDYYLYIDTDGDAHACPFCSGKVCDARALEVRDTIRLVQENSTCDVADTYLAKKNQQEQAAID